MKYGFGLLFIASLLTACEKYSTDTLEGADNLIGCWVDQEYSDTLVVYHKFGNLVKDQYGFTFHKDFTFTERKIAGWCGTPPVAYKDYEGTWTRNDSLLYITSKYWGGTVEYTWKIISLKYGTLKIREIK